MHEVELKWNIICGDVVLEKTRIVLEREIVILISQIFILISQLFSQVRIRFTIKLYSSQSDIYRCTAHTANLYRSSNRKCSKYIRVPLNHEEYAFSYRL